MVKRNQLQLFFLTVIFLSCQTAGNQHPIALHPDNPHYFLFKDKPIVLITSAEHYGAVINLDFDYVAYLEALSADGLNLTRVFSGAYAEPVGAFNIEKNTLAPKPEQFICPWPRSDTPGYANGGNKFDLSKWDEEYFLRLKDFMREAAKRNIIVEFTLFCPFYEDRQWNISPMNDLNNIQGGGSRDRNHVYTLDKSKALLSVQEKLVRKIVHELKDYNNLLYEICNEPYFGGVTLEWQHHIASLIHEEEKEFSHPHLITQNIANGSEKIKNPHPAVSVFNFHYATPPLAVKQNYSLNKVLGDNETGFNGNSDSTYRKEGWEFILAGGALFNNLDYSFTADHETGTFQYPATQPGGGTPALRKQLGFLQRFISSFDLLRMHPDTTLILNPKEIKGSRVLSEPGKQYAVYLSGKGPFNLELSIPAGNYRVQFMDPLKGTFEKTVDLTSEGKVHLTTPSYPEDVALKISKKLPE